MWAYLHEVLGSQGASIRLTRIYGDGCVTSTTTAGPGALSFPRGLRRSRCTNSGDRAVQTYHDPRAWATIPGSEAGPLCFLLTSIDAISSQIGFKTYGPGEVNKNRARCRAGKQGGDKALRSGGWKGIVRATVTG